ncbi:hypothetical protein BESB_019350 [Besnoitia besnoiti]|uniref:Chorein N-terminal domain-containing protein n=1 Tax=Besnoitia besnoiti TaxID=94643 RepID=A0A2A9M443_BESBE|nr:hypothetical protein BESB_019350 [Besnoitia besnoiti]PFH31994.1 hypothetical protein BESB_019350 [Besnoitia besnoiti]
MLEALVERLLSRYLAPYVTGISRDKLSVAVWSGDVELEDLQVKPEISDLFGLPFRVVWGRLKRIRLSIPWSKLGAAPVCLEIEGVHLLLEPKPIPEQTDAELIQQLRETKRQQIDVCEQQMLQTRSQLLKAGDSAAAASSADRGVFFKFANKIINSVQIDVSDIHVAFSDPSRGFKIGVLLADCSVHNTDALWRRSASDSAAKGPGEPAVLYKACELNGLAVYCSLAAASHEGADADASSPAASASAVVGAAVVCPPLRIVAPLLPRPATSERSPEVASWAAKARSSEETLPAPVERQAVAAGEGEGDGAGAAAASRPPRPPQSLSSAPSAAQAASPAHEAMVDTELDLGGSGGKLFTEDNEHEQAPPAGEGAEAGDERLRESGAKKAGMPPAEGPLVGFWLLMFFSRMRLPLLQALPAFSPEDAEAFFAAPVAECRYVLKPLHMRLLISHSTALGELSARLEVKKESQGIEIGRTQLKALLDISHEAAQRRRRCESLLLRSVHAVRLDAEGLKGITEKEFIGLYTREIQASANIRGVLPLNAEERERLQILYDVVGVRHLAKWQAICKEALTRIAEQTQQRQLLRQQELAPPPERLTWWQWATQGRKKSEAPASLPSTASLSSVSAAAAPAPGEEDDQPLLTKEEVDYIVNSVQSDTIIENISVPTVYRLSFDLVHFGISLRDDDVHSAPGDRPASPPAVGETSSFFSSPLALQQRAAAAVGMHRLGGAGSLSASASLPVSFSSQDAFLAIELFNWSAALNLQNKQDASGAENSQWSFSFSLSNFCVRHRDQVIMHFRKDAAQLGTGDGGKAAFSPSAMEGSGADSSRAPAATAASAFADAPSAATGAEALEPSPLALLAPLAPATAALPLGSPQQAAARLELSHDVTDAGNILGVVMRLAPLVAAVRPDLLKNLLSFFVFEEPEDVRRHRERQRRDGGHLAPEASQATDAESASGVAAFPPSRALSRGLLETDTPAEAGGGASREGAEGTSEAHDDGTPPPGGAEDARRLEQVEEMKKTEFVENLKARGGTVYTAAVQRFPALLQIDVCIAAPILHFSTDGRGQVALQFGTLVLRTDGTCPYEDLRGIVELNETRIICQPPNQEEISLLRPIPIRVHLDLKRREDLTVSFLLEEIFLEITPEALAVLLAVPASVTKSLIEIKKKKKRRADEALGKAGKRDAQDDAHRGDGRSGRAAGLRALAADRDSRGGGGATPAGACERDIQLSDATVSAAKEIEAATTASGLGAEAEGAGGPSRDDEAEEKPVAAKTRLNISCTCCIDHCGFVIHTASGSSLSAAEGATATAFGAGGNAGDPRRAGMPVLRAEFCTMTVQMEADVFEGKYSGWAELQRVFVSDPSTASPLFLTLHETDMKLSDAQLYETMATSVQMAPGTSVPSGGGLVSSPLPSPVSGRHRSPLPFAASAPSFAAPAPSFAAPAPSFAAPAPSFAAPAPSFAAPAPSRMEEAPKAEEDDDEFQDAIEEREKSVRVDMTAVFPKSPSAVASSPAGPNDAAAAVGSGAAAAETAEGAALSPPPPAARRQPEVWVAVSTATVEVHWQQHSIKQILWTLREYKRMMQNKLQLHLEELKKTAEKGDYTFLSKEAVVAMQETLHSVQKSLSYIDVQQHLNTPAATAHTGTAPGGPRKGPGAPLGEEAAGARREGPEAPAKAAQHSLSPLSPPEAPEAGEADVRDACAEAWMTSGLSYDGDMPPLATEKLAQEREKKSAAGAASAGEIEAPVRPVVVFELKVKGAAIAFWKEKHIFSRMGVRDFEMQYNVFENGDGTINLEVGGGAIIMEERCILAPRGGEQPNSAAGPAGASCESLPRVAGEKKGSTGAYPSTSLFSARIRHYAGVDPVTNKPFPYSVCLQGVLHQVCYVYFQKDVAKLLEYLNDGIFNVFITKSYHAVKQAATRLYFLFAVEIACPVFILCEDKEIIPGFVPPVPKRRDVSAATRSPRRTSSPGTARTVSALTPPTLSRASSSHSTLRDPGAAAASVASAASPSSSSSSSALAYAASHCAVDLKGLGSYVTLDLGHLRVRNAYVWDDRDPEVCEPSLPARLGRGGLFAGPGGAGTAAPPPESAKSPPRPAHPTEGDRGGGVRATAEAPGEAAKRTIPASLRDDAWKVKRGDGASGSVSGMSSTTAGTGQRKDVAGAFESSASFGASRPPSAAYPVLGSAASFASSSFSADEYTYLLRAKSFTPSALPPTRVFTLSVEMFGLTIGAADNASAGGGTGRGGGGYVSRNVQGCLLENVDAAVAFRSSRGFVDVDLDTTPWCLRLSRQQLTFVLDVINENLAGKGYRPAPVVVTLPALGSARSEAYGHATPPSAAAGVDVEGAGTYPSLGGDSSGGGEGDAERAEQVRQALEDSTVRVRLRMTVPQLLLEASFGEEAPLALFSLQNVVAGAEVSLFSLYFTYHFVLCAQSFAIDDIRTNSANFYKRLAECYLLPAGAAGPAGPVAARGFSFCREGDDAGRAGAAASDEDDWSGRRGGAAAARRAGGEERGEAMKGEAATSGLADKRGILSRKFSSLGQQSALFSAPKPLPAFSPQTALSADSFLPRGGSVESAGGLGARGRWSSLEELGIVPAAPQAGEGGAGADADGAVQPLRPAIKIEFASSLQEGGMHISIHNATIYLLTVELMDFISYFTSSWAFSTMRCYPKPAPPVLRRSAPVDAGPDGGPGGASWAAPVDGGARARLSLGGRRLASPLSGPSPPQVVSEANAGDQGRKRGDGGDDERAAAFSGVAFAGKGVPVVGSETSFSSYPSADVDAEGRCASAVEINPHVRFASFATDGGDEDPPPAERSDATAAAFQDQRLLPASAVVPEMGPTRDKPFRITVTVSSGRFILYTDLKKPTAPVLQWTNDFYVNMVSAADSLQMKNIDILDCRIARLDVRPPPSSPAASFCANTPQRQSRRGSTSLPPATLSRRSSSSSLAGSHASEPRDAEGEAAGRQSSRSSLTSSLSRDAHLVPILDDQSAVLLCEAFRVQGQGTYRSVDAKEEFRQRKAQAIVLEEKHAPGAASRLSGPDAAGAAAGSASSSSRATGDIYRSSVLATRQLQRALKQRTGGKGASLSFALVPEQLKEAVGGRRGSADSEELRGAGETGAGAAEPKKAEDAAAASRDEGAKLEGLRGRGTEGEEGERVAGGGKEEEDEGKVLLSDLVFSFDIPVFFLRVSSRDMALLLAAATTIYADTPSVNPDEPSPPIRPPLPDAFLLSSSAAGTASAASASGAASARAVAASSAGSGEVSVSRALKVDIKLQGVHLLLLDDLRASVVPLVRLRLSVASILIEKNAQQFLLRLKDFNCGLDYLNHRIGSWEPFVERFCITAIYRFDYEEAERTRLQQQLQNKATPPSAPTAAAPAPPTPASQPSVSATTAAVHSIASSASTAIAAAGGDRPRAAAEPATSGGSGTLAGVEDPWRSFKAVKTYLVTSTSPLWLNVTPELCKLLTWFVPYLAVHLGDLSRATERGGGELEERDRAEDDESALEGLAPSLSRLSAEAAGLSPPEEKNRDPADVAGATAGAGEAADDPRGVTQEVKTVRYAPATRGRRAEDDGAAPLRRQETSRGEKKRSADGDDLSKSNAAFRYINLSGNCLYAFTLLEARGLMENAPLGRQYSVVGPSLQQFSRQRRRVSSLLLASSQAPGVPQTARGPTGADASASEAALSGRECGAGACLSQPLGADASAPPSGPDALQLQVAPSVIRAGGPPVAAAPGLGTAKVQQTVGVLVLLQPTGTATPLDDLTQGLTEEASRRARRRQRIYLARCPPAGAVDRLAAMFPDVPRAAIIRNLNVTQDVTAAANAFLVRSQLRASQADARARRGGFGAEDADEDEGTIRFDDGRGDGDSYRSSQGKLGWDVSPADIGPFPRGMRAVAVDIMRNCCVTLLPPFTYSGADPQAGSQPGVPGADCSDFTDLTSSALLWASSLPALGPASARGKGAKGAAAKGAPDFTSWTETGPAASSPLKPAASFVPRTFASRQFQKLKQTMSSTSLAGSRGGAEGGEGGSLRALGSSIAEKSKGRGSDSAPSLGPLAGPWVATPTRDRDERETCLFPREDDAVTTAASQGLLRTSSRNSSSPATAKTLGGLRRLGSNSSVAGSEATGGPGGLTQRRVSPSRPAGPSAGSLALVPEATPPSGRLSGLSGALGKRTTVGHASTRDGVLRSEEMPYGRGPRQRETSLIMPPTASGYRDFLDAAAGVGDGDFSSDASAPSLASSRTASLVPTPSSSSSARPAFASSLPGRAGAVPSFPPLPPTPPGPRGGPVGALAGAGPGPASRSPSPSVGLLSGDEPLPFLPLSSSKNELICEVLSPHPSYKLLMVTSTVKLFNYSGLPLQFCFLDSHLNPLLLPCAEAGKAKAEAVFGAGGAAGEGGAASGGGQSFHEVFSSHGELKVVPPWLREKEALIDSQVARDVHEQIGNVLLLDEDASGLTTQHSLSSGSLRSSAPSLTSLPQPGGGAGAAGARDHGEAERRERIASPGESLGDPRGGGITLEDEKEKRRAFYKATYSYTFLLEDKEFMSVPQPAILGAGWCYLCFRPAAFAQEGEEDPKQGRHEGNDSTEDSSEELPSPPDMSSLAGWTDLVDTRQRMEGLRCRQSAYVPPWMRKSAAGVSSGKQGSKAGTAAFLRASAASTSRENAEGRAAAAGAQGTGRKGSDGVLVDTEHNMYFLVNIEGRKSGLPAEKDVREISIFPALTLINATPVDLDVTLAPSSVDLKLKHLLATSLAGVEKIQQLQAYPLLRATLLKQSTFYAYGVPPNRQLKMKLKFARLENAGWSSTINDLVNTADEVVSRLLLPAKNFAPVELEVLRDSTEVAHSLSFVKEKQLSVVISAPRCFIDRTGLGFLPVKDGRQYPVFDNQIILLGDSTLPEVNLVLPSYRAGATAFGYTQTRASKDPAGQIVQCSIDVPALGGFSHTTAVTKDRCFSLCMNTERIDPAETGGVLSRVVSLLPEYIISNFLHGVIYYRHYGTQGPAIEVKPNTSYPIYWSSPELPFAFQFRPGTTEGYAWSGPIVASEEFAGQNWLVLYNGISNSTPGVFDVEVCPDNGVKSVSIRHSSEAPGGYVVINKCKALQKVMVHTYHYEMALQGPSSARGDERKVPDFDFHFFAQYGESVHFGWPFPFTYASRPCQVLLWIDSRTVAPKKPIALDLRIPQHKRYEVSLGLRNMPRIIVRTEKRGDCVVIEVRSKPGTGDPSSADSATHSGVEDLTSVHLAVNMAELGISLISESLRQELCFAELSQVALGFQQKGERQKLLIRLADIQIDNQLANAQKPVLLANRGGAGSSQDDAWGTDRYASKSFLTLFVVRHHALSRDLALRRVHVELDTLEVEIDADMLNGLNDFFHACLDSLGLGAKKGRGGGASQGPDAQHTRRKRAGVTGKELQAWVSHPLQDGYVPPPLPTVLSLESLVIEKFDIFCWCSFVLDKMHMLSDLLKVGLRILMASGRLELMGARLQFQREEFRAIRGSARTFLACLHDRYTHLLLSSIFSSLGQSSLLNLPRMPYEFGKNTIGLAANAVDSVSAGLGSLLSTLTFDSEYINRRQRERVRTASSMRDGFLNAGKNIGEGVWSLTNIVTKPIEGAQREGVGGFFKGIGKGLAGSLVKPLDKVGQAVSDMTRGIKAEVSKPLGGTKCRTERRRKPRMLWGEYGEIRPYDEREACLRECLGLQVIRRLLRCVTVLRQETLPARHLALLFYPKDVFFVDLYGNRGVPPSSGARRGATADDSEDGGKGTRAYIVWHVSIPLIKEVRASTHGIIIRTSVPGGTPQSDTASPSASSTYLSAQSATAGGAHGGGQRPLPAPLSHASSHEGRGDAATAAWRGRGEKCYQVPCQTAALTRQIYQELLEAQGSTSAVFELGSWRTLQYAKYQDED